MPRSRADSREENGKKPNISLNRRNVLQAVGAGIATTSIAGCTAFTDNSDLHVGILFPRSGGLASAGQNQINATELAIDQAKEVGDLEDLDVKVSIEDTETDPTAGRRRAQELIDDDVDIIVGGLSSSVGVSIADVTFDAEVPFITTIGELAITGEDCQPYTFNFQGGAVQRAGVTLEGVLEQGLGESVLEISHNYAFGQSIQDWNENHVVPKYDAEYVDNLWVPLGAGDLSSQITQAIESGADIVNFNLVGGDHIASVEQAHEFGLIDEAVNVHSVTSVEAAVEIDQEYISHENWFGTTVWYWEHDAPDAQEFVDLMWDEYEERPLNYAAAAYAGARTSFEAIGEMDGLDDVEEFREQLEDRRVTPQLWDRDERMRACDHRATVPAMTVKGRSPDEYDEEQLNPFEILYVPDDPEAHMRSCEETGCQL